jgi:ribosomal protein L3 glutamine methyltransferase
MLMRKDHPGSVGALIEWCAERLDEAGVFCGHGTAGTFDESASLVFHVANLEHDAVGPAAPAGEYDRQYDQPIDRDQFMRVSELLRERIEARVPLPYLLNEAWFAGLKFFVDERVLIPRSPLAELILARFSPWLGDAPVERILEIGTGSGCIAIACARAFPEAEILATDLSPDALDVAAVNVERHGVASQVRLLRADLFDGVKGRFDLIVSNPPYVPEADIEALPPEYGHEPRFALASGPDGLASSRRILQDAAGHLTRDGTLVLEVGSGWPDLEAAFPTAPFVWPEFEHGGEGVALLRARDLEAVHSSG